MQNFFNDFICDLVCLNFEIDAEYFNRLNK